MKNDKIWKALFATFLVLCAIFVGMYAYNNRYTEVKFMGYEVAFDKWTQEIVAYSPKGAIRYKLDRYELENTEHKSIKPVTPPFFTSDSPYINTYRLHHTLSNDYGVNLGTLGEMKEAIMANLKHRRWLYDKCVKVGLNVGTYREFEKALDLP